MNHPLRYILGVAMFAFAVSFLWQSIRERNRIRLFGHVLMMVGSSMMAVYLTHDPWNGSRFSLVAIAIFGLGLSMQTARGAAQASGNDESLKSG